MQKRNYMEASMSVEAAVILPLFLFFVVNIFSLIEMYRLHSNAMYALWNSGREVEQAACLTSESSAAGVLSEAYVGTKVKKQLETDSAKIVWPSGVFTMIGSSVCKGESDIVDLRLQILATPPFPFVTKSKVLIDTSHYGHAWTGYNLEIISGTLDTEIYVYVTENGTVYHQNVNCAYLNPTVEAVNKSLVNTLRNSSGGKYYACASCHPGNLSIIFITNYGESYHSSTSCSALKRTIYQIPLSEAVGKGTCSKCGR